MDVVPGGCDEAEMLVISPKDTQIDLRAINPRHNVVSLGSTDAFSTDGAPAMPDDANIP